MSDSLLAVLNSQQKKAVTLPVSNPPAHGLILAGAGSGKTRVLTTRAAWLLATGQSAPHAILAVTFTNKAAHEMRSRLASMTTVSLHALWIGTFHGLCHRMLRLHHQEANLPKTFQILDRADQLSAIKRLVKEMSVDDEKHPPRDLLYFIDAHKEEGIRAYAVEAWDNFSRQRKEIYEAYEAQCQREGAVDFSELLLRAHELLSSNEPLRRHYQERFRHILIDEFQDTNRLQYEWLQLLAGKETTLFAVGDDDQSIYAFRGAKIGNMRDFERRYAGERIIRLEQNYRSHGNILGAANALIRHNRERLGKNLWTEADAGEPIRVFPACSDLEEAAAIAEEIDALKQDGNPYDSVALLYRANAQSRALEHELFIRAIPYRVYGGLRFFERQEIKHALAYLRLIANPADDTAFLRVVNFPARGIGARALESLQAIARQRHTCLYDAAASLSGKAGMAVSGFIRVVNLLRQEKARLTLSELVEQMLESSGLTAHYQADRKKENQERLENLDELINAAALFTAGETDMAESTADPLLAFLSHASLEAGEYQAGINESAVQLMTVHAAKGLEFDHVFITGLEEGLFPHDNAVDDNAQEEERRLMYVAMTRARRRLYLTRAESRLLHGQRRYCLPSRFFQEIPSEFLKNAFSSSFSRASMSDAAAERNAAPSFPPEKTPELPGGLRIGMNVRHATYGFGVIVDAEIQCAEEARVQVNFGSNGMKWLALPQARLEAA
ncbi:MAG: UvrD-helicase domain-containing protein [Zoogloeaceae bacterium]|jgi:DNA helicase-2/ATP-dependent DNA helicase PcrA|nr:UvrD-helicase domain-containing protein [Zoogloeaceae bacterium]